MLSVACPKGSVVPPRVLVARARIMLAHPTESESRLWARIRGGRLGTRFIRQAPIAGRFVADLLAPACKLVVEIDGLYHGTDAHDERENQRRQKKRDEKIVKDVFI